MSDFFEDVIIGETIDLDDHLFTREAIIAFATAYDPQPFHIDDEAAARGPFGRLAASGWHTAAVWMKAFAAHRERTRALLRARGEAVAANGPSPGFKDLRWIRPVYVGDTIRFAVTITNKQIVSRPGWGLVHHRGTGANHHGEPVYSFEGSVFWQRRLEDG